MGGRRRQDGFTLIMLLVTVAIVGILFVAAMHSYQPALKSFESGSGDRPSFRLDISKASMQKLHQAEVMYYDIHRSYATWGQLMSDGMIARGYSDKAQGGGTPFIPVYDINIEITSNGFTITATPNMSAGASPGMPILRIDQEGALEEVPTK